MTTLEDARDVMPRPLKLAKVIRGVGVNGIVNKWLDEAADAIESLHAEVEALRGRTRITDAMVDSALHHWFNEGYIEQNHGIQYRMRMALVAALKKATPPAQEDGK